jgi:hypothetical protein
MYGDLAAGVANASSSFDSHQRPFIGNAGFVHHSWPIRRQNFFSTDRANPSDVPRHLVARFSSQALASSVKSPGWLVCQFGMSLRRHQKNIATAGD